MSTGTSLASRPRSWGRMAIERVHPSMPSLSQMVRVRPQDRVQLPARVVYVPAMRCPMNPPIGKAKDGDDPAQQRPPRSAQGGHAQCGRHGLTPRALWPSRVRFRPREVVTDREQAVRDGAQCLAAGVCALPRRIDMAHRDCSDSSVGRYVQGPSTVRSGASRCPVASTITKCRGRVIRARRGALGDDLGALRRCEPD